MGAERPDSERFLKIPLLAAETASRPGIPLIDPNLPTQASCLALGDKAEKGGLHGPIGAMCAGVQPARRCVVLLLSR